MKTLLYACAALVMSLGAVTARAADVTGSWTAEMKTPDGDTMQLSFTFKQDGAALTGAVLGPQGDALPISDGKVDGNKLSFKIEYNGTIISHDGTISDSGDEIKLANKSDSADIPSSEMTLTRVKPSAPAPAAAPSPQP
jgi:hypothetical protein